MSAAALTDMSNRIPQRSRDLYLYHYRVCCASLPVNLARDKLCVTYHLPLRAVSAPFQGCVVVKVYAFSAWLARLGVNECPTLILAAANTLLQYAPRSINRTFPSNRPSAPPVQSWTPQCFWPCYLSIYQSRGLRHYIWFRMVRCEARRSSMRV